MRPRQIAAALLAPVALAACASSGRRGGGAAGAGTATLEVRNDHLGPVNLYAVRQGGYVRRIGSVFSSRVERFRLGSDLIGAGGSLQIIAVPVAANGRASTGALMLQPGETVRFNVANNLAASSVFVR
jgi:hypothetical protein